MDKLKITEDIIVSHSICQRKSYQMLFQEYKGKKHGYTNYLLEKTKGNEAHYFQTKNNCVPFSLDNLTGKADIIISATINFGNLVVKNIHLQKKGSKSRLGNYSYEPLLFSSTSKIAIEDRIKASYLGYVLYKVQGSIPKNAVHVLMDRNVKSTRLNIEKHLPITSILKEWIDLKPQIPLISLSKHCSICPFEKECLVTAEKEDSISLLGKMSPKTQRKYESKGIFTIKQLSYLYKPRRRSRFWGERKLTHQYELQALALRTRKIYTTDLLELPNRDIEIYIDVESIPEQRFHYLIGILISKQGRQHYTPYWANEKFDEKKIWECLIEATNRYPTAPIFHYSGYEKIVINELAKRYDTKADNILDRLSNLNQYIYGRIYFPTRTNRLKDICDYLGLSWTSEDASGLNSIVWRYNYDLYQEADIKNKLIIYNLEDCTNLKKLKDVINAISSNDTAIPDVMAANEKNQLLSTSNKQVVTDFTTLIKSAHGKYENSKISWAKNNQTRNNLNKSQKGRRPIIPKSKVDKNIRVARGRICPLHKRTLLHTDVVAETVIINLVCTPKGIKKTIIRYWGYKGRCPNCSHRHTPPGIKRFGKRAIYGRGLKAWITYQRLTMRLPLRKISQLLEDTFNIVIANGGVGILLKSMSSEYINTENNILKSILNSPKIHVDETTVNIRGRKQYVWVFTDGNHVIFKRTPTRESSIVHSMLSEYEGVLVSDFYPGYDAVECSQQKCWVHLIRDINDDLRKNPFDIEFEIFTSTLRNILIPIFNTVEKYGLKKRNLNKFQKSVERFYKNNIVGMIYCSDITKKYQKRFIRYKKSLFVFLEHNEIPWNNNMAERALRHLAVQRKISGSFSESGIVEYLRILGIMQTCRFQNKPFLEFLMSEEKDVDSFKGKKNIKGWAMT